MKNFQSSYVRKFFEYLVLFELFNDFRLRAQDFSDTDTASENMQFPSSDTDTASETLKYLQNSPAVEEQLQMLNPAKASKR